MNHTASASTTYVASFVLFLFGSLDKFKTFGGLGFKAEMWERKQKEAEDLIITTRQLIRISSRELMLLSSRQGRFATTSRQELFALADKLQKLAIEIKLDSDDIEDIRQPLVTYTAIDMALYIVNRSNKLISGKAGQFHKDMGKRFPSPITVNASYNQALEEWRAIGKQAISWDELLPLIPSHHAYVFIVSYIDGVARLAAEERSAFKDELKEELEDLDYWLVHKA